MYAIIRHRAAINAWCWRVRFSRRGKSYSKTFYDLKCGSSRKARAMAIARRDDTLRQLGALTLLDLHTGKRSNNVSGVPGVHFHKTSRQPLGFCQAKIRPRYDRSVARSFSVFKFDEDEAHRLADAARSDLLPKVEHRAFVHSPVTKKLSARASP